MLFKKLGPTSLEIPELGIGTWNYHAGPDPLRRGLEAGALFIDTAESYGSEEAVGQAIAGLRDRVFIATKVSPENFRARDFHQAVEGSLRRMRIDAIDLLQLHEPNTSVPIDETMGAMSRLIDSGKVRYAGVSNFSVKQLQEAQRALGRHPIVSNQVRYNLIDRTIEGDLLHYCRNKNVTVIAYCPLARGLDRIRDCDPSGVIDELSRVLGRSPAQIVLNWCLCQNGVVAIPKGNSISHILDNCGATDWRLTAEQLDTLNARIKHRRRNRIEGLMRTYMPGPLQNLVVQAVDLLPAVVRRRIH